jgi:hypothetical protein
VTDPPLPQVARRRSLGEITSDTFNLQTPHWRTFAAVTGPAVLMGIIFQLVVSLLSPESEEGDLAGTEATVPVEDAAILLAAIALLVPVYWVIQQLCTAGVVEVLKGFDERRTLAAGDALDAAQDRARDILLASLRATAIVFLFCISILGIPWGIKRLVQWSFIVQAIMAEGIGHRQALQRSADLVRGRWWATFGYLIVIGLLVGLTSSVVGGLLQQIVSGVPGIILAGAVGFFTTPYMIIATTLIYFDLRLRKEQQATPRPPSELQDEGESEASREPDEAAHGG